MSDTTEAPPRGSAWETNAPFWVQIIREHRDKYRTELTDPAMFATIGPPEGLVILDAGCAEGYLARQLAARGATVTGIDSSTNLIEAARSAGDGLAVTFDVGSVEALPYADNAFDLVVCNHVMNDLHDPSVPIQEFGRVTRRGGRLVILMLHPCFYNKHAERADLANGLLASDYFQTRSIEQPFEVDGLTSPAMNTSWFRPLEFYTSQLKHAGYVITGMQEPHPSDEQREADSFWRRGFTRPLFMLIAAERT
jgi:SAM-dependent methyltransferase